MISVGAVFTTTHISGTWKNVQAGRKSSVQITKSKRRKSFSGLEVLGKDAHRGGEDSEEDAGDGDEGFPLKGGLSGPLSSLINQECVVRTAIDPAWRRVNRVVFI